MQVGHGGKRSGVRGGRDRTLACVCAWRARARTAFSRSFGRAGALHRCARRAFSRCVPRHRPRRDATQRDRAPRRAEFKWDAVKQDKYKENYLGHSLHTIRPTFNDPNPNAMWYLKTAGASRTRTRARARLHLRQ